MQESVVNIINGLHLLKMLMEDAITTYEFEKYAQTARTVISIYYRLSKQTGTHNTYIEEAIDEIEDIIR